MAAWQKRWTRDRHERCIREWKVRQRRDREWISFADIAEWCSRVPGDLARDRARHAQAYTDLLNDALAGVFDQGGRCRVAYLPEGMTDSGKRVRLRVSLDYLDQCREVGELAAVLAHCWVPRALCLSFLEARGIRPWPGLEPQPIGSAPATEVPLPIYKTGVQGRPTSIKLVGAEMRRRAEAKQMIVSSFKEEAEWLAEWLIQKHEDAPRLTTKTIQNSYLRREWRSLKAKILN